MPYMCPVCSRKHSSLKMVAYIRKDGFTLNCWSGKNKDKVPIKHTFEKVTQQTQKQNRLQQLREYADTTTDYNFTRLNANNVQF